MRRVKIEAWCDFCWQDGEQLVERARSFCVGVVEGENLRPIVKLVEACEQHSKIFDELLVLLDSAEPISPDAKQSKPSSVAATPKRDQQAALFRDQPLKWPKPPSSMPHKCPICDTISGSRHALIGHVWTIHRSSEQRPEPLLKCPECSYRGRTLGATGQHRRNAHGHDQLTEALAGIYTGPLPQPVRELTP